MTEYRQKETGAESEDFPLPFFYGVVCLFLLGHH